MSTPILATKLYIPPPPAKAVRRSHLIERLAADLCADPALGRKLTLISAPAGFGKTTLVSEWLAACDRQAAWLSLDEADSDPRRFLTYLVAALRSAAPNFGAELLQVLEVSQPPAIEPILTALLNEITAIHANIILVLDDYHLIDNPSIDAALSFLVEHLPPQVHLVITTREDPRLPLARLRARGQLTEVRAADLRFTASEAEGFFRTMSLHLEPDDIRTLETRTEGWIAGLQLAALALQSLAGEGQMDASGFIREFAGDHRYIVDYLLGEVLERQPETVRSFLLQTAILERLNGPLCDAVTGGQGSRARLEALERGNFFVVRLDDRRHWYRYHHLFADVLAAYLQAEQPDLAPTLHRRASEWYEHNGPASEAIRHALAAPDLERAARLIETAIPTLRSTRQEAAVLSWLQAFPVEVIRSRPVLGTAYAWALLSSGKLEGVEERMRDAEAGLQALADFAERPAEAVAAARLEGDPKPWVDNREELRQLPGALAALRAGHALVLGDVDKTLKYARWGLDLVAEDDHLWRGAAASLIGLATWTKGDLEAAYQSYAAGMASVLKAGHVSDAIGCVLALADIRIGQGRLRDAMSLFEDGYRLATGGSGGLLRGSAPLRDGAPLRGSAPLRGASDMLAGMSELHREHNDLPAALQALQHCQALGELLGLPQNPYRWRAALARIRLAEGDLDGALELFEQAERVYAGDFSPDVRPLAASKARVWFAQGKLRAALDWAGERGLSASDELSYLREYEHITLARLLLAQARREQDDGSLQQALGLLRRLLQAAEASGRRGSVIEIRLLQALAQQVQGDLSGALQALQPALAQAEPEGYRRIFLDEGEPMARLLREAGAKATLPAYAATLSADIDAEIQPAGVHRLAGPAQAADTNLGAEMRMAQLPIEPLSSRELEVLRLFQTELSGPEIARELVIALSTVRTHTKSIYGKLNVNSRRAAVKRAIEMKLI